MSAVTAAAATIATAGFGVGAADTFRAAFFRLVDIKRSAAKDRGQDRNNQKINHTLFLSGKFCLQFIVRIDTQKYYNANHYNHRDQTAAEADAHRAGSDECADLVD